MGLFTRDIKTMSDLFVHQSQDIYYAEQQLVKAPPKMAEKTTEQQLKRFGCDDCASIMQKTLDEEKATGKKLTSLAEAKVNLGAAS